MFFEASLQTILTICLPIFKGLFTAKNAGKNSNYTKFPDSVIQHRKCRKALNHARAGKRRAALKGGGMVYLSPPQWVGKQARPEGVARVPVEVPVRGEVGVLGAGVGHVPDEGQHLESGKARRETCQQHTPPEPSQPGAGSLLQHLDVSDISGEGSRKLMEILRLSRQAGGTWRTAHRGAERCWLQTMVDHLWQMDPFPPGLGAGVHEKRALIAHGGGGGGLPRL